MRTYFFAVFVDKARTESSENGTFSLWLYATSSDRGNKKRQAGMLVFFLYMFMQEYGKMREKRDCKTKKLPANLP